MDTQSLAKLPFNLKILQTDRSGVPVLGIPFLAMLNPESYAVREAIVWHHRAVSGRDGHDPSYISTQPRSFSVELLLDGTGVNTSGVKIPVTAQVALFRATTTNVEGLIHRPPYLLLQYGTFIINCVLQSSTVTYTMFDFMGLPIRAKLSATFLERKIQPLSSILGMLSSPDLTHRVKVREGDLLPVLTRAVYKDQSYYLQVARANKLKNFRRLQAGTTLVFPPIASE